MLIAPKFAPIPDVPSHSHAESATPATADADDGIVVRFDGVEWLVDDGVLDQPLKFARMSDAEERAAHLSKSSGRGVTVRGRDGELLNQYSAAD